MSHPYFFMKRKFNILTIFLIAFLIFACTPKKQETIKQEDIKDTKEKKINIKKNKKLLVEKYKQIKKYSKNENTRGIYLTTYTIVGDEFENIISQADSAGINTIIFDIKNMKGELFLPVSQKSILGEDNIKISLDIASVVKTLHRRDMKAVARVVMFHNQYLSEMHPEFRPGNIDGGQWVESKRRKPSWLDPSNDLVQKRLFSLIDFVCANGIDELQMDYIRFPTQGNLDKAVFAFELKNKKGRELDSLYVDITKEDVIEGVVKKVKKICNKYDAKLAADIFAITAWQQKEDVENTGQNIERLSKHLDYLHPMVYSSHFAENFGYRKGINNEPYLIVYWTTKLSIKNSSTSCKVVPYIQGNDWKVNFKEEYVISQVEAIEASGGDGYILWNSGSRYDNSIKWIMNRK